MSIAQPKFTAADEVMRRQREEQLRDRISGLRAEIMALTAPGMPGGLSSKECRAAVKSLSIAQRALKTLQKEKPSEH